MADTLTVNSCFSAVLLFLGLVVSTNCHDAAEGSVAVSYDKETFQMGLVMGRNFVMFYAPWCGHCKKLMPVWDELAKRYNKDGSPVVIAKVDCTVHKPLCMEHDIMGFPTLKLFEVAKTDNPKRYTGNRDLKSLKDFINDNVPQKIGESMEPKQEDSEPEKKGGMIHLTDENWATVTAKGSFFIKFYAPWCGHCKRLAPAWNDLASNFANNPEVNIAMIDCQRNGATCSKFDVRGYPTLLWFTNGKKIEGHRGARSIEALNEFVERMIALKMQESLKAFEGHMQDFNDHGFPTQTVDGIPSEIPGAVPQDVVANLRAKEQGQILDLTDLTFNAQLKHTPLVFVKFYAPWCGHCKKLAPAWKELAETFKSTRIAIAKVDCTLHKPVCKANGIRGYPTLKMFRNGVMVNEYQGPRALENLVTYANMYLGGSGRHDEL